MAAADTKELAQCLAFAYFAENPTFDEPKGNKDSDHAIGFYTLFSGTVNVSNYKKKYLSDKFPLDAVKREFAVTKTATGKPSYHTTAKKVYNVAKACVKAKIFKYPLNDYEFLDQNDPFVLFVKDKCLDNIKKAFHLNFKVDAISSVDVFFVKKTEKKKILDEFKKYFTDTDTILKNTMWNQSGANDYSSVVGKFMKEGTLMPISLKLPNNVTSTPKIKRVSFDPKDDSMGEIDPFIKFLAAILDEPTKTKQMIDKVIEIDFDKFVTHELLNWVFPVNFNYHKLIDPATKKPLEDYHLRFNLFAQGYGAGWNGQFDVSTKMHKDTQWVGGTSIKTFEEFARSYPDYKKNERQLTDQRIDHFKKFCARLKEKNYVAYDKVESLYPAALKEISKNQIVYGKTNTKNTREFFDMYDVHTNRKGINDDPTFTLYQNEFINIIRGYEKKYSGARDTKAKIIDAHYAHAQISYFLTEGGKNFQVYFKQKLFMTVYGLITKTSHRTFELDDYAAMRNAIVKYIQKDGAKEIINELSTPPHYIIS